MNKYNSYTLFKFINSINDYETNLIPHIKSFLKPDKSSYLFQENEYAKKIIYEVSDHEHNYDSFLNKKYKQVYCPCYFNKKHKKFLNLKKQKSYITVKIKSLEYDFNTFEKEYIVIYQIHNVFYNELKVKENELVKIKYQ